MTGMNKVRFHSKIAALKLPAKKRLKDFIVSLFKNENSKLISIDYIFCSDQELLEINIEYLKHDYYTDIITFDLSENGGVIGEVYISVDRVTENAADLEVTFLEELHRVMFHGALHLVGYGDKTKREKVLMRRKEEEYLHTYFKQ
jgi:rRNA maturation RNase YbeY